MFLVTAALTGKVFAQSPAFDVVSIKLNYSGTRFVSISPPGSGTFTAVNVNLNILMAIAYDVRSFQVSGSPGWTSSERYDIVAKTQGKADKEEIASMLRAMLADRFRLKVHRAPAEMQGYGLAVAKGGIRARKSDDSSCVTGSRIPCGGFLILQNRLEGRRVTLKQLASTLAETRDLARPVLDISGVDGLFDIQLEWTPAAPNEDGLPADSVSIFTALQEQLGLRLEGRKVQTEMLVVDYAERASEN
jgi:uncharacterized protein (TIGR03435 family)